MPREAQAGVLDLAVAPGLTEEQPAARPTAAQAIKLWRLRKLEQQVREQMALYARSATRRTVNGQEEAIGQATRHTAEMVDAITVDSGHPVSASASSAMADLDPQAVSAIVGSTRRGSPLRRLFDDASTEGADAMVKVLRNGVIAGDDVRTISRGLEEAGKITRTRSVLIARTEVNRAYQEATHERIQDPEIFDGWIWSASLSPTTCAACLAKNGSRHKPSERMSDHPPRRCVQIPLVAGEDAPEIPDSGEWLKGQPARIQEACLGSMAAAAAFRNGEVILPDFVAVRKSSVWGDSISRTSLKQARESASQRTASGETPRSGPPIGNQPSGSGSDRQPIEVEPFRTTRDAERYWKEHVHQGSDIDLHSMDNVAASQWVRGLAGLVREFGVLPDSMLPADKYIGPHPVSAAWVVGGGIYYDLTMWKGSAFGILRDRLAARGHTADSSKSVNGYIAHEYAHVLQNRSPNAGTYAAIRNAEHALRSHLGDKALEDELGRHATSADGEIWAEAFSAYWTNPQSLSSETRGMVEGVLKIVKGTR